MKSDNRWVYVGGVVVLVVLVLVGVFWGREDEGGSPDAGGDSGGDASGGDARPSESGDGAVAARGDRAEQNDGTMTPPPGDAGDDIGEVPGDPEECQVYCRDLAQRGVLANDMTADECISQLCPTEEGTTEADEAPAAAVSTLSPPTVAELPDDCAAQCGVLHESGELRSGMSVAECVAAMCSSDESDEDESAAEEE